MSFVLFASFVSYLPHRLVPLLLVLAVMAEEPRIIDLATADLLARAHSERVLAARAGAAAVLAEQRAVDALFYPDLSGRASWQRLDRAVPWPDQSGAFADGADDEWAADLRVDQFLWAVDAYGSRRALDRALRGRTRAETAVVAAEVAYAARQALHDWALASAGTAIAELRLAQRREERDLTGRQADPAVGLRSAGDVARAEIAVLAIENDLEDARSRLAQAHLALAAAIAEEPAWIRPVADLSAAACPETLLEAARQAIANGAPVAVAHEQDQTYAARDRRLQVEAWPTFSAWAEYGGLGDEIDGLDEHWALGIGATWRFYDGGRRLAEQDALRLRRREVQRRSEDLVRQRRSEVERLALQRDSLHGRIARQERAVALADAAYAESRAQFEAGLIDVVRLGDASLSVGESRYRLALLQRELLGVADRLGLLAE